MCCTFSKKSITLKTSFLFIGFTLMFCKIKGLRQMTKNNYYFKSEVNVILSRTSLFYYYFLYKTYFVGSFHRFGSSINITTGLYPVINLSFQI